MPYEVSFDEEYRIVNVCVSGAAAGVDHYAARHEALRLCHEKGCSKILVNLRELNTKGSSTIGCFEFGESLAQTSPYVRIAHVMPTDAKSREDVRFVANVEANRGRPTGEFETIEDAITWLCGC